MTHPDLPFLPVPGNQLGTAAAGIKYPDRDDLVVVELADGATCAAVFTRNAFCAAPVVTARDHLRASAPRYLLINSGNANAGTGAPGLEDAVASCGGLAKIVGCELNQVLPFSTGVIGERLPMNRLLDALPRAVEALSGNGWAEAARAIMTTDTLPKLVSRQFKVDGHMVTVRHGQGGRNDPPGYGHHAGLCGNRCSCSSGTVTGLSPAGGSSFL